MHIFNLIGLTLICGILFFEFSLLSTETCLAVFAFYGLPLVLFNPLTSNHSSEFRFGAAVLLEFEKKLTYEVIACSVRWCQNTTCWPFDHC